MKPPDPDEASGRDDVYKVRLLRELRAVLDELLKLTDRLTNLIVELLRQH